MELSEAFKELWNLKGGRMLEEEAGACGGREKVVSKAGTKENCLGFERLNGSR